MNTNGSMSTAPASPLLEGFEGWLESGGQGRDPLAALRAQAYERLSSIGMPTRRHEDWRFTELGPLGMELGARPDGETSGPAPTNLIIDGLASLDLHFHDGRLAPGSQQVVEGIEGLSVHDLSDPAKRSLDAVRRSWERSSSEDSTFLETLNAMWCDRGALIEVAEKTVLDRPLRLVFTGAGRDSFVQTRLIAQVGRHAQVTLVEDHGRSTSPSATNFVVDVQVDDDAHLNHVKLVRSECEDQHAANLRAVVGRDGRYRHWDFAVGGRWLRNDLRCTLAGENSEISLEGLVVAGDEQMVDHHTRIVHAASHARSLEHYRHVLDDRARGVFAGRVVVEKDVHATRAEQQNANLLLSDSARMNALPQLEIYNDDVTASHGATMGQLDRESLFYLRTRGIPELTARALLLWGFANTIVQGLGSEPIARLLQREVHSHLTGLEFLEDAQ